MIENMDYSSKVLDLNMLTELTTDTKLAFLRAVSYRTTVEGRPFFRMVFMDVNGFSVIGRMFNINNYDKTGKIMNRYIGHVCLLDFDVEFPFGEASLSIKKISPVKADMESELLGVFKNGPLDLVALTNKYNLALRASLESVPTYLAEYVLSQNTPEIFSTYSQDDICRGINGGIMKALTDVLSSPVEPVAMAIFILALKDYCQPEMSSDAFGNLRTQTFITKAILTASMLETLEKEQGHQPFNVKLLMSDFIGLLTKTAIVFSPETKFIYDLYEAFVRHDDMKAHTDYLPKEGFIQYGKNTLRK